MEIISTHYYRNKYFHLKLSSCQPQITYLTESQVTYCVLGTLTLKALGFFLPVQHRGSFHHPL